MKSKKLLVLGIGTIISMTLVGCGGGGGQSPASSAATSGAESSSISHTSHSSESSPEVTSEVSDTSSAHKAEYYTGHGAPNDAIGEDGDIYVDLDSNTTYYKENGKWVSNAPKRYSGEGEPDPTLGKNGDTYIDTITEKEYVKVNGSWVLDGVYYKVSFSVGEGSLPAGIYEIPDQYVKAGSWAHAPNFEPILEGSTFLGWYDGYKLYDFNQPVYGDLILVAKFEVKEEYKVVFYADPNGGSGSVTTYNSYAGAYVYPTIPTRDGYDFIGWFIDGDQDQPFTGTVTTDLNGKTIKALWAKANFNFYFTLDSENHEITITGLVDVDTVVVNIPDTIEGYPVVAGSPTAFNSRISIKQVNVGKNVRELPGKAMAGCRAITNITVDSANQYLMSDNGILYNKQKTILYYIPPKNCTRFTCPSTLKKIAPYACYNHVDEGVADVTFNEGLEEIGEKAFYRNTGITQLIFPSTLKVIGDHAFFGDVDETPQGTLQKAVLNEGLIEIGDSAFACQYLKDTFTIPTTVKIIKEWAFCMNTAITGLVLPSGLEEIHGNSFGECTGLQNISFENNSKVGTNFVIDNDILLTADRTKVVMVPTEWGVPNNGNLIIPEGVTEIGDYACYFLKYAGDAIEFPSTLEVIGHDAFRFLMAYSSITLPDSVKRIEESAFEDAGLSSINLGKVEYIGKYAFFENSLSSLLIPSTLKVIDEHAFSSNRISNLEFEEGIEEIKSVAFTSNRLTEIYFPNSLKKIGYQAFASNSSLELAVLGSGLEELGGCVFEGASAAFEVTIRASADGLVEENGAIYTKDYEKLLLVPTSKKTSFTIHAGCKEIGDYAFYRVPLLSLTIPDSVTKIGDYAFGFAFNSKEKPAINIPGSVKTIGEGAFYFAYNGSVQFNEGLEEIGEGAFYLSDIDQDMVFPDSLKIIHDFAFYTVGTIRSVTFGSNLEEIGEGAFMLNRVSSTNIAGKVTLPASLKKLGYQAFAGQTYIEEFAVEAGNTILSTKDGVLFNSDQTKLIAYPGSKNSTEYIMPDTVKIIDSRAMESTKLTSLTLSANLERIEEYGLKDITNVLNLSIPASVKYVGERAFENFRGTLVFNCTRTYAITHFAKGYDSSIKLSATVVYIGDNQ